MMRLRCSACTSGLGTWQLFASRLSNHWHKHEYCILATVSDRPKAGLDVENMTFRVIYKYSAFTR